MAGLVPAIHVFFQVAQARRGCPEHQDVYAGRRRAMSGLTELFDHPAFYAVGGSQTSTRIGVGLKPLHGLLTCGQLEITKITSMSAVMSTESPPAEMPSATVKFPDGSIG